ncbi:TetR/AcrR family transcriptional regulator [Micromonospora sp. CPCC 205371]|nr:TetR/AcrR family transcriptional regulator [Micromonospora sp. CPCC 205371]
MTTDSPVDHRKGPRRRGEALVQAVYAATLAELTEFGYAGLRMERIAERARTGKASLYRRWPSRADLVVDAIRSTFPDQVNLPETGSLRQDLLTALRYAADQLDGPAGEAVRGLMVEALSDPERTKMVRARITEARAKTIGAILQRAAQRGEVNPDVLTPQVISVAPALIAHQFLTRGAPIPDEVLTSIVDEIVLPLVQRSRPAR